MDNKQHGGIVISDDYVINAGPLHKEATECIGSTMFKCMKMHKDNVAEIEAETGRSNTYAELLQRSIRTALHMTDRNITRDHIVTLCTPHHLDAAPPYVATQFLGAKIASLDPTLPPKEIAHLLKEVRPKILFVVVEVVEMMETILKKISLDSEIVVFGQSINHTSFEEFLQPHEGEETFQPVQIDDLTETAIIHFSSGTTGMPKGICINHYAFISQAFNALQIDHPDIDFMRERAKNVSLPLTVLSYTSFYWVSAASIFLISVLQGWRRLLCAKFDGKEAWNLIGKFKPCTLNLTPIQAMALVNNKPEIVDVASVLNLVVIGSPISKEYMLQLKNIFPQTHVVRGYGQTEVCGPLTNFKGNDVNQRLFFQKNINLSSVGLPVRGILYRVVDLETGKNVGPNRQGELRVKTKLVMNGYFNADFSATYDEDGWLKTGDIVYYDEDFCFYVVDRIKEAFKYQGWFIAPAMLENELSNHPAVKQAVVIGVPKVDGHHALGVVVLHEGVDATEEEIEKFVEERVPDRQRLRAGVKIVKSIPLTVTGKVKRNEIKAMLAEVGN